MYLTIFEAVEQAYIEQGNNFDAEWVDVVALLCDLHVTEDKAAVPLFNLLEFKKEGATEGRRYVYENGEKTDEFTTRPGTIRRAKENLVAWHGVVVDFDHGATIEETIERLKPFEFLLYTSFSHTAESHRFRVIIPFLEPLTATEMEERVDNFMLALDGCDRCSFSFSQSFYLYSAHPDRKDNARIHYNQGEFMDAKKIPATVAPVVEYREPVEFTGDAEVYNKMLLEALNRCSGVRYSGNVGRQHGVTLVRLCKSIEMNYTQFVDLIGRISAADSSLRVEATRKQLWGSVGVSGGITRKVRDDFLSAYGAKFKPTEHGAKVKKAVRRKESISAEINRLRKIIE